MGSRPEFRHDLFVAYASPDDWWVRGFLLPALDLPAGRVITEDDFQPGAPRLAEFTAAVTESRFTAVVLTPDFLADAWAELGQRLAGHLSVDERRVRIVPILLRLAPLPLDLQSRVHIDCTRPDEWEPAATRLRAMLAAPEPEDVGIPCPYPGMAPFTGADAAYFFGRDAEVRRLARLLPHVPSVFVIGPSGSGKSSLVNAGLLPELVRRDEGWLVRSLRPGAEPVRALRDALEWPDGQPAAQAAADLVARGGARRLLLVVDQLEEVFVQASPARRAAFIQALRAVRAESGGTILCSMRADFYPDLMSSALWPIEPGERIEIVPPRGDALRAAIDRPARALGVHLEPALLEQLVTDAAAQPGALPLLQETLRRLWDDRSRRTLTLAAYRAAGHDGASPMAVALATWADAALASLTPAQREVARRVFLRLVHLGEGRDDTRRRQPVETLRVADEDPAAFDAVLRRLVERRLVTVGGTADDAHEVEGPGTDGHRSGRGLIGLSPHGDGQVGHGADGWEGAVADLAHESVIAAWPTLRRWVTDGREAELLRRRIERDAHEWRHSGRHRTLLYRGRRLRNAREWRRRYAGEPSLVVVRFLAAGRRLDLAVRAVATITAAAALAGVGWLAVPAVQRWELRRDARAASPMVHLAGGPAVLGGLSTPGTPVTAARQVRVLAPFSIDLREVSNRQYRMCIRAGRCSRPLEPANYEGIDARPDLPVVYVTAYQAADFCRWLGRRLPTGAEWERAARGQRGRTWPWGTTTPVPADANVASDGPNQPSFAHAAVADVADPRFAAGRTPEGVTDLIGNVWEWTSTPSTCAKTPYSCSPWNGRDRISLLQARGSSFADVITTPAETVDDDAATPQSYIGFRCAAGG